MEPTRKRRVSRKRFDFGDCKGPVPAHRHPNGKGWVADTATVEDSAFVGPSARVFGNAQISDNAQIRDNAQVHGEAKVYENAKVYGDAEIYDNAKVHGNAEVYDNAQVSGDAEIWGNAQVYGSSHVYENAQVSKSAKVYNSAQICNDVQISRECSTTPIYIFGLEYPITITDKHVKVGYEVRTVGGWKRITKKELLVIGGKEAIDFYPKLIGAIDLFTNAEPEPVKQEEVEDEASDCDSRSTGVGEVHLGKAKGKRGRRKVLHSGAGSVSAGDSRSLSLRGD